jgi:LCP family protein required for cell wall assembly
MSPEKPPRPARGLLLRALVAGVVIVLTTASAVSATVMLQVDDIINIIEREGRAPIVIPEIDRADAGSAQTIMILGSDRRYGDRRLGLKPRSDTIILVRLDPDRSVIAVTSVPRDLLVDIPGLGRSKINAAYELGGERSTVRTVKRLLSTPERPFRVNHVVTVDFSGFRRVIDYIGCVYVDIDRDYFNDIGGPGGYATIDIDPGYQKLCGRDSLDYVRYRHGDNDLVRAARQQDFLRQIRNQRGIRRLSSPAPNNLRKLARIFARYFDSDKGLRQKKQIFGLAKTVLFTSANPVREVKFRVSDAGDGSNLVASPAQLEATVDEFLEARASASPRQAQTPTEQEIRSRRLRAKQRRPAAIKGLEEARAEGEDQAIVAARDVDFPFFFPTVRTTGSGYVGQAPRTYKIRDELGRKHDAYRLVIAKNTVGEYYGVQGTTWREPPILDDPAEVVIRNGRRLRIYRDGRRIRLVAWRTRRAVYWVSNTLTQSLTGPQMIGIAASMRKFGKGR